MKIYKTSPEFFKDLLILTSQQWFQNFDQLTPKNCPDSPGCYRNKKAALFQALLFIGRFLRNNLQSSRFERF
ncbi:MAG: hypothetical protein CVU99_00865 [Firmicutes bacterium HGW-Firmicutes-4]|nr:MAG: hypothetical protein CVU99_00865 [Firmicutes bacterium HGW-Firmicutes-4]